jgi:hypothetical protein
MQSLRQAHWITRLVLVWLALFMAAAVASPVLKSEGSQMVCGALGVKLVNADHMDSTPPAGMDCPLCMPTAAPTPAALPLVHPQGLGFALHPAPSAPLGGLTGPPWQARGPPVLLA